LLYQSGVLKAELKRGEHKSLQTDRVILRPGPPEEVEWVNKIYLSKRGRLRDSLVRYDPAALRKSFPLHRKRHRGIQRACRGLRAFGRGGEFKCPSAETSFEILK
jgi:hypothetical protein